MAAIRGTGRRQVAVGGEEATRAGKTHPNMTACHTRMLPSMGAPVTPVGGSFWSFLKSCSNRRRAAVLMVP